MGQKEGTIVEVLPNYLDGCDDHTKHVWRQWRAISEKIDNHPERFIDVGNQVTGAVKTFDCKGAKGLVIKWDKQWSESKEDIDNLSRITEEIQRLKTKKMSLNCEWTKLVGWKKKGAERTMLDVRQNEIIDLYSKFYTTEEITKIITDKWGFAIKFDVVRKFFIDNREKIERKRADYVLNSKELRLATDAGRLELLSKLAWEFEVKFDKTKSLEVSKELRAIVEQIRKEVKGDEIRLTVDGKIDITATIQANQSLQESLQKLPINMIVIGLTAARQKINPAHLIASLSNSFYSKFNGFNQLGEKDQIELPGKYIKSYNWDEIRQKNESNIIDVEPIEVFENQLDEREKVEAKTTKQQLMENLNRIKKQVI